jgi:ATP-dependent DNA helicase PIF1
MINLEGKEYEYKVKYHCDLEMNQKDRLVRIGFTKEQINTELMYLQGNIRCDEIITLKVGSQVMCIANIELSNGDILCNGAQGIVVGINPQGLPIVKYKNGYQMTMSYHIWPSELIPGIGVSQIPLILAWALTIHKAQGATLELAEVDAGSGIFECGQTYVALSRVKSLEGLYLSSFDAKRIRINKRVQDFYEFLKREIVPQTSTSNELVRAFPIAETEAVEVIPIAEAVLITSKTVDFTRFQNI